MGVNVSYINEILADGVVGFTGNLKLSDTFDNSHFPPEGGATIPSHQGQTNPSQQGQTNQVYGKSLSISNSYMVIGFPTYQYDSDLKNPIVNAGAIVIYKRNVSGWEYFSTVFSDTRTANEEFGYSVSINENNLLVGTNNKKVYIYNITLGGTIPIKTLSEENSTSSYGNNVFLTENGNALVSDVLQDGTEPQKYTSSGVVYVYNKNNTWNKTDTITIDNGDISPSDYFGNSIDINSNNIIASSSINRSYDGNNENYIVGSGSVYTFSLLNGSMSLINELVSPNRYQYAAFGTKVFFYKDDLYISDTKNVYLFTEESGIYSYNKTVYSCSSSSQTITDFDINDFFVVSVYDSDTTKDSTNTKIDIFDNTMTLVYSYSPSASVTTIDSSTSVSTIDNMILLGTGSNTNYMGSAILLTITSEVDSTTQNITWDISTTTTNGILSDRNTGDKFGTTLYYNDLNNIIIASAPYNSYDENIQHYTLNAGSLYVWKLNADNTLTYKQKIVSPNRTASANFGTLCSTSKNTLVVLDKSTLTSPNMFLYTYTYTNGKFILSETDQITYLKTASNIYTDGNSIVWLNSNWNLSIKDINTNSIYEIQKTVVTNTSGIVFSVYDNILLQSDTMNTSYSGVVNVYKKQTDGSWTFDSSINDWGQSRNIYDQYGYSVVEKNDYLYISAPYYSYDIDQKNNKTNSGLVYIYTKNADGTYNLLQKIQSSSRLVNGNFGINMTVSDNNTLYCSSNIGHWTVEEFMLSHGSYSFSQVVDFGKTLSSAPNIFYSTNLLFVSDIGTAVYCLKKDVNNKWILDSTFTRKDISQASYSNTDQFGTSVLYKDSLLLISAPNDTFDASGVNSVSGCGSVYIYNNIMTNSNNNWKPVQKISGSYMSSGNHVYDEFGSNINYYNDMIIIGAFLDSYDENGQNYISYTGSVYIVSINNDGNITLIQKISEPAINRKVNGEFGLAVTTYKNKLYIASSNHLYEYYYTNGKYILNSTINTGGVWPKSMLVSENRIIYITYANAIRYYTYVSDSNTWVAQTSIPSNKFTNIYMYDNIMVGQLSTTNTTVYNITDTSITASYTISPEGTIQYLNNASVATVKVYDNYAFYGDVRNNKVHVFKINDDYSYNYIQSLSVFSNENYQMTPSNFGGSIKYDNGALYISDTTSINNINSQRGSVFCYNEVTGSVGGQTRNKILQNSDYTFTVPENCSGKIRFYISGDKGSGGNTAYNNVVIAETDAVAGDVYQLYVSTNGVSSISSYNGYKDSSNRVSGGSTVLRKNNNDVIIVGGQGTSTNIENAFSDSIPSSGTLYGTGGNGYKKGICSIYSDTTLYTSNGLNYINEDVFDIIENINNSDTCNIDFSYMNYYYLNSNRVAIEYTTEENKENAVSFVPDQIIINPDISKTIVDFGQNFDFSNNLSVIGGTTSVYDSNGNNSISGAGAAYIFSKNNDTKKWIFEQKITPTGTNARAASDYFGNCCSIFGNNIIVSSRTQYDNSGNVRIGTNTGAAWVFTKNADTNTWEQIKKISQFSTESLSNISSFDSNDDILIMGAPQSAFSYDSIDSNTGAVFNGNQIAGSGCVYILKISDNYSYMQKLYSPNPLINGYFGYKVKFYNNKIYVSEPGLTTYSSSNGKLTNNTTANNNSLYEYSLNETTGNYELSNTILAPLNGSNYDLSLFNEKVTNLKNNYTVSNFGFDYDITDNTLLISDPSSYNQNTSASVTFSKTSYMYFTNNLNIYSGSWSLGGLIFRIWFITYGNQQSKNRIFSQVNSEGIIDFYVDLDFSDSNNTKIICYYDGNINTFDTNLQTNASNRNTLGFVYNGTSMYFAFNEYTSPSFQKTTSTIVDTQNSIYIIGNNNEYDTTDILTHFSFDSYFSNTRNLVTFSRNNDTSGDFVINMTAGNRNIGFANNPNIYNDVYFNDSSYSASGLCFLYDLSTKKYIKILSPFDYDKNFTNGQNFGHSVSIDPIEKDLVIGFPYDNTVNGSPYEQVYNGYGSVYLYKNVDNSYIFNKRINNNFMNSVEQVGAALHNNFSTTDIDSSKQYYYGYLTSSDSKSVVSFNLDRYIVYSSNCSLFIPVFIPSGSKNITTVFSQNNIRGYIDCTNTQQPIFVLINDTTSTKISININTGMWQYISLLYNARYYTWSISSINTGTSGTYSYIPASSFTNNRTDLVLYIGPNGHTDMVDNIVIGSVSLQSNSYSGNSAYDANIYSTGTGYDFTFPNKAFTGPIIGNNSSVITYSSNNGMVPSSNIIDASHVKDCMFSGQPSLVPSSPYTYETSYISYNNICDQNENFIINSNSNSSYDSIGDNYKYMAGLVYVWKKDTNASEYKISQVLESPDRKYGAYFGSNIKLDNNSLLVQQLGNLYIYKIDSNDNFVYDSFIDISKYINKTYSQSTQYNNTVNLIINSDLTNNTVVVSCIDTGNVVVCEYDTTTNIWNTSTLDYLPENQNNTCSNILVKNNKLYFGSVHNKNYDMSVISNNCIYVYSKNIDTNVWEFDRIIDSRVSNNPPLYTQNTGNGPFITGPKTFGISGITLDPLKYATSFTVFIKSGMNSQPVISFGSDISLNFNTYVNTYDYRYATLFYKQGNGTWGYLPILYGESGIIFDGWNTITLYTAFSGHTVLYINGKGFQPAAILTSTNNVSISVTDNSMILGSIAILSPTTASENITAPYDIDNSNIISYTDFSDITNIKTYSKQLTLTPIATYNTYYNDTSYINPIAITQNSGFNSIRSFHFIDKDKNDIIVSTNGGVYYYSYDNNSFTNIYSGLGHNDGGGIEGISTDIDTNEVCIGYYDATNTSLSVIKMDTDAIKITNNISTKFNISNSLIAPISFNSNNIITADGRMHTYDYTNSSISDNNIIFNNSTTPTNNLDNRYSYCNYILNDNVEDLLYNFSYYTMTTVTDLASSATRIFYNRIGRYVKIYNGKIFTYSELDTRDESDNKMGYINNSASLNWGFVGNVGSVINLYKGSDGNYRYSKKIFGNNSTTSNTVGKVGSFSGQIAPYNNDYYVSGWVLATSTPGAGNNYTFLYKLVSPSVYRQDSVYTSTQVVSLQNTGANRYMGAYPYVFRKFFYNNLYINKNNLYINYDNSLPNYNTVYTIVYNETTPTPTNLGRTLYDGGLAANSHYGYNMMSVGEYFVVTCNGATNSQSPNSSTNNTTYLTTGCCYVYDKNLNFYKFLHSTDYNNYPQSSYNFTNSNNLYSYLSFNNNTLVIKNSNSNYSGSGVGYNLYCVYTVDDKDITPYGVMFNPNTVGDNISSCYENYSPYGVIDKDTIITSFYIIGGAYNNGITTNVAIKSTVTPSYVFNNTIYNYSPFGTISLNYMNNILSFNNGYLVAQVGDYYNLTIVMKINSSDCEIVNIIPTYDPNNNISKANTNCNTSNTTKYIIPTRSNISYIYSIDDDGNVYNTGSFVGNNMSNYINDELLLTSNSAGSPYGIANSGYFNCLKYDSNIKKYVPIPIIKGDISITGAGSGAGYIGGASHITSGLNGGGGLSYGPDDWNILTSEYSNIAPNNSDTDKNLAGNGGLKGVDGSDGLIVITDNNGNKSLYGCVGADQTYIVPPNTTSITIKIWAAGGGGSTRNYGLPGGFITGTIDVTPSQVYTIVVGKGGLSSISKQTSNISDFYNYGSGSYGTTGAATTVGGAGGCSSISLSGKLIAIAGSGAGAGTISLMSGQGTDIMNPIMGHGGLLTLPLVKYQNSRTPNLKFGTSLEINNNSIYIGSPGNTTDEYNNTLSNKSGCVFKYEKTSDVTGDHWDITGKILPSDNQYNFGKNITYVNDELYVISDAINIPSSYYNGKINISQYDDNMNFDNSQTIDITEMVSIPSNISSPNNCLVFDKNANVIVGIPYASNIQGQSSISNSGAVVISNISEETGNYKNVQALYEEGEINGIKNNDYYGTSLLQYNSDYILIGNNPSTKAYQKIQLFKYNGTNYDFVKNLYEPTNSNANYGSYISCYNNTIQCYNGNNIIYNYSFIKNDLVLQNTQTITKGSSTTNPIALSSSSYIYGNPTDSTGSTSQGSVTNAGTVDINNNGTVTYYSIPGPSNTGLMTGDRYGTAVRFLNNKIFVVGSPYHQYDYYGNQLSNTGAIYTYNIDNGNVYAESFIVNPDTSLTKTSGFGKNIKRVSDTSFITSTGNNTNTVSVINRNNYNNWKTINTVNIGINSNNNSGYAYNGKYMLIGNISNSTISSTLSPLPYTLQDSQGGISIYQNNNRIWSQLSSYILEGEICTNNKYAYFGSQIRCYDNTLIVSAIKSDIDKKGNKCSGNIYLYDFDEYNGLSKYITSYTNSNYSYYGQYIDISKNDYKNIYVTGSGYTSFDVLDKDFNLLENINTNITTSNITGISASNNKLSISEYTYNNIGNIEIYNITEKTTDFIKNISNVSTDTQKYSNIGILIDSNSTDGMVYSYVVEDSSVVPTITKDGLSIIDLSSNK